MRVPVVASSQYPRRRYLEDRDAPSSISVVAPPNTRRATYIPPAVSSHFTVFPSSYPRAPTRSRRIRYLISDIPPVSSIPVPLHHIRNGTLGIKGHVFSFVQDISEVATVLPRLPSNVKAVKMIRTYTGSDGKPTTKTFVINRKRVLRALRWLIRYHRENK